MQGSAGVLVAAPTGPTVPAAAALEPGDADARLQKRQLLSPRRAGFQWAKYFLLLLLLVVRPPLPVCQARVRRLPSCRLAQQVPAPAWAGRAGGAGSRAVGEGAGAERSG